MQVVAADMHDKREGALSLRLGSAEDKDRRWMLTVSLVEGRFTSHLAFGVFLSTKQFSAVLDESTDDHERGQKDQIERTHSCIFILLFGAFNRNFGRPFI